MVVVITTDAVDVHGDAGGLGEALQAVRHHLGAQLAEPLALEAQVDDAVGTVGEIDNGAGEGLVEGSVGGTEAGEAGGGAEGLGEGVAQSDAAVLGGVVVVDCELFVSTRRAMNGVMDLGPRTMEITLAVQSQTPAGVLGQGVEHVIEEANAGVDGNLLRLAGLGSVALLVAEQAGVGVGREIAAIEVERKLDLGLVGVAGKGGPAGVGRGSHCAMWCLCGVKVSVLYKGLVVVSGCLECLG